MLYSTDIPQGPLTKSFIKQFLPEAPIILEAGAHIGRDTLKLIKTWPKATIHAFEPVHELFAQLQANTAAHATVFCYQLALSTCTGIAYLYVSSGASTAASSLLKPKRYSIQRPEVQFTPVSVQTVTLSAWAQERHISHIDFMWLDMQGHELAVLQTSTHMLKQVKALLIEVSLTERFEANPLYYQVRTWLEQQGFKAVQQDWPKHEKINIFFAKI